MNELTTIDTLRGYVRRADLFKEHAGVPSHLEVHPENAGDRK
jgi:hypothetical protein